MYGMESNQASARKHLALFACLLSITLVTLSSLWNSKNRSDYLKTTFRQNEDLSFSVSFGDPVAMHIDDSTHYELDSELGSQEYAKLMPSGGHVVHIVDAPYTVSLFHQLKCLDIVRQQYVGPSDLPISALTNHCMNYLRQSILCRLNLRLESTRDAKGTTSRGYEALCRDWTRVYDEAERNHERYMNINRTYPGS